jgi:hypothetical protein
MFIEGYMPSLQNLPSSRDCLNLVLWGTPVHILISLLRKLQPITRHYAHVLTLTITIRSCF